MFHKPKFLKKKTWIELLLWCCYHQTKRCTRTHTKFYYDDDSHRCHSIHTILIFFLSFYQICKCSGSRSDLPLMYIKVGWSSTVPVMKIGSLLKISSTHVSFVSDFTFNNNVNRANVKVCNLCDEWWWWWYL